MDAGELRKEYLEIAKRMRETSGHKGRWVLDCHSSQTKELVVALEPLGEEAPLSIVGSQEIPPNSFFLSPVPEENT